MTVKRLAVILTLIGGLAAVAVGIMLINFHAGLVAAGVEAAGFALLVLEAEGGSKT